MVDQIKSGGMPITVVLASAALFIVEIYVLVSNIINFIIMINNPLLLHTIRLSLISYKIHEHSIDILYVSFVSALLISALNVVFIFNIYKGKKWARFGFLILCIFYSMPVVKYIADAVIIRVNSSYHMHLIDIRIICLIVQFAAFILLFSSSSNSWFKKVSK